MMINGNKQSTTYSDPIELELSAMELMAHPETLQMQMLFIAGYAVVASIESAAQDL